VTAQPVDDWITPPAGGVDDWMTPVAAPAQPERPFWPTESAGTALANAPGRAARAALQGTAGLFDMVGNAGAAVGNAPFIAWDAIRGNAPGTSEPFQYSPLTRMATGAANDMGLPQYEQSTVGRVMGQVNEGAAGAAPTQIISRALVPVAQGIGRLVARAFYDAPGVDVTANAVGGGAQGAVQEAGGGDAAAMGANFGGAAVTSVVASAIIAAAARRRMAAGLPEPRGLNDLSEQEFSAAMADPDVQRVAQSNGITEPGDPRLVPMTERLAARREAEAARAEAAPAVTQADINAARMAVEEGANPAAVEIPRRAPVPEVVQLPEGAGVPLRGTADPNVPGLEAGVELRGGRPASATALVPTEPQVQRMTPAEIARAQALMEAEGRAGGRYDPRGVNDPASYPGDPAMVREAMNVGMRADDAASGAAIRPEPPVPEAQFVGRGDLGPSGRVFEANPLLPRDGGGAPAAQQPPRALPAPARALPAPEARAPRSEPAPRPQPARAEQFRVQAERSAKAAERLEMEVSNLQAALARFFDRQSGANMLAARGAKMPRDLEGRTLANLARQYPSAREIGRAITTRQREAEAARGRAEIQRRGAEREGTPEAVPYQPRYNDPKLDAPAARTPPQKPRSLTAAVRELGGIKGHGGDLEGQAPGVRNERGMTPDLMVARLQESGWLPGKDGLDAERALFEGLAEERRGRQQFRDGDRSDFETATARHEYETQALLDMGREMGLGPEQVRGMSRGQFEDMLRERMSQEEMAARDRALAEEIEAEVAAIRTALQDEAAARGDSWEPEINRTLDDYLADYGTRSLDDAERTAGEGAREPAATPEASGRPEPVERAAPEDRAGAEPGRAEERPAGRDEQGGGPEAPREGERSEQGGEVVGRDPLRRTTEDSGQAVMPGMEASTKQAIAARDAAPMRGDVPQRGLGDADTPLFDVSARDQTSMINDAGGLAGGKLYSGFDPAMIAKVLGVPARAVGDAFKRSWLEATSALRGTMARPNTEARVPRDPNSFWRHVPNPLRTAADFSRMVFYADDARMRALADTLPKQSREAMRSFLDRFHARAGDSRGAGRTYDEAVEARVNTAMRALGKSLGKSLSNDAEMAQIVRMVQNPSTIRTGTRLGDAADGVRNLLAELHAYQKTAGVEVGEIKRGYFPRILDTDAVLRDRPGFLAAAERAYKAAGGNDPAVQAQAWLDNITAGGKHDNVLTPPMSGIHADHVNGRTLTKAADDILRPYLHQDPKHVLATYISAAARRAEFARAVGQTPQKGGGTTQAHWDTLVKALRADGAEARIQEVRNYVANVTGAAYAGSSPAIVRASSRIRMWATLGLLEKATVSSLAEAIMPAVRSGNVGDLPRGLLKTVDDLVRGAKGKGEARRLRELAEDIGVIASAHAQSLNAARWAGGDATSSFQNHVLDKYFRRTGLEQWTRATRVAAVSTGEVFLNRLAHDMAKRDGYSRRTAQHALGELGVPKAEQAAFAAWLRGQSNSMTAASLHLAPAREADMFRTAIQRFVDQSIMRPSAATRPRWASHPLGSVAFQLNNFAYAFHKNVLARPLNMLKSDDLTRADKAIYAAQMLAGVSMMLPAQIMISSLRSELLDDPRSVERRRRDAQRNPVMHSPVTGAPVGAEQLQLALSRSGLLGAFDPAFNVVTGVRYGKDLATSLAGPAAGTVLGAAQTGIEAMSGRNSPNTNTAERRVARVAWDAGVEPAINLAATWLPLPIGAAVTQAAGHGGTRGAFMDAVAGPEQRRRR
jgi:hypothetical protein